MILVVEDEPIQRMLASDLLQEAGYEVREAATGEEALGVLAASPDAFTHVFTDVRMPGRIDGLGLARVIAERFPQVRVVITSAHISAEEAEHCVRFVPKPWTSIDVLNVVV